MKMYMYVYFYTYKVRIHWYAFIHIQSPKIEIGCVLKIKNFFWHSIEDKYNHNAVWQG